MADPAPSAATVLSSSPAAPAAAPAAPAVTGNAAALAAVPAASDPPVVAAVTPPAAAAPVTPAANQPWYGDLTTNAELKTFAETKAFKDPVAALEAYRNLERMVGAPADQIIRRPKDANDAEGIKAFRTALGVPAAATDYGITSPAGPAGADFVTWASNTFLEAGIPKEAAGTIVAKWNEYATAEIAKIEAQEKTEFASGMVKLQDQWGGAYNERVELAKRALRAFGPEIGIAEIGDAGFKALEKGAGGGVQLIKLLAAVGARTSEDAFVGGGTPVFTMTKETADAKIAALRADKAWSSAYLGGDKNKQAEMLRLQEISAGTAK